MRWQEVICNCALANAEDVDKAVKSARAALSGPWGTMGGTVSVLCPVQGRLETPMLTFRCLQARGRLMNKFADLLEENADEMAALESLVCAHTLQCSAALSSAR